MSSCRFAAVVAISVAVSAAVAWPVGGAVHWISPTGDDGGDGSRGAPWRSVKQALAVAADGDTVLMTAGDYTFPRPSPKNRTKEYVTFKPAPGDEGKVRFVNGGYIRPYDNCDYLRLENLKFECGLYFTKVKHFQVRACVFDSRKANMAAILISGEDILVEGCETMGGSIGIAAAGKDVIVRHNDVHQTVSDGFRTSGENIVIEGNYFHDNNPVKGAHPDHIQFFGGFPTNVRNVTIRGNYFDAVGQGIFGGAIDGKDGGQKGVCDGVLVENNVVVNSHLRCWSMNTTNNVVCRNNLFGFLPKQLEPEQKLYGGAALVYMRDWGGGQYVFANNICRSLSHGESDKLTVTRNLVLMDKPKTAGNLGPVELGRVFVDYAKHDYTIRADSPTIDAGSAEHAAKTDILGRPRGDKPDIGPVEFSKEDTRPLLEMFLERLRSKQEEIRASTIHKPEAGKAGGPGAGA